MSALPHESKTRVTHHRQLVEYFSNAVKPRAEWRIGCEHEKFPYRLSTLKPVSYGEAQGMRELYNSFQQFDWQPVMEGENIIGLARGSAAISFEPGEQVELSGAPLFDLHQVAAEVDQHLFEANELAGKLGIGLLGIGFHPTAKRDEIPWVPKGRYNIMREYMPKRGRLGHDMMLRTCTTQVNLDFSCEADMIKKYRVSLALQPIATALFAASPFTEGKLNGFQSYRMNVWTDTDNDRSGPVPFVFEKGFGFERYTDYALDVPMYFVYRDGYIDCSGQSFHDFLQGKLPALPGETPTLNDWANHLTTLFPDVRLKKIIEMRGADTGNAAMIKALPPFWVGLLYDETALNDACMLIKDWSAEDRKQLHDDAPRFGIHANFKGRKVRDLAKEVLGISQRGLKHRGHGEEKYLDILFEFVESGQSYADQLVRFFEQSHDMKTIFDLTKL